MKKMFSVFLSAVLFAATAVGVSAKEPYENYTYNNKAIPQSEPQAYVPVSTLRGSDLGIGDFKAPEDVFVSAKKRIYISDTGNNRIVVLDSDYKLLKVIDHFNNNGKQDTFQAPNGLFVTSQEELYLCDSENGRIVCLNEDGSLQKIVGRPKTQLLRDTEAYIPQKISVDSAGRLFIVAKNVNEGMIELTPQGEFVGFFGAITVSPDLGQIFWKMIATEEQKKRMNLTLPTEYSNVDIDEKGFVYGVVSALDPGNYNNSMFIRRLNPMGNDVLKRLGNTEPMGDAQYDFDDKGLPLISQFEDIAVKDSGIYAALDKRRGRIFTYNSSGELMYVFGGLGTNLGQFGMVEALDTLEDDFLVVDSKYNWMIRFRPTEYGQILTEAVRNFYQRDFEKTDELFAESLKYTVKSQLAYDGIGRSLIKSGDYQKAMDYLFLADNRTSYSEAFEYVRKIWVDDNFGMIFGVIVALAAAVTALVLCKKIKKKRGK